MNNQDKIQILFLCTGNSCRSQMADRWTRKLKSDLIIEVSSAGVAPSRTDPRAFQAMEFVESLSKYLEKDSQ